MSDAAILSGMDVRVGKRAQVVIPAALRRRMGVKDGDVLHAELDEQGRLVLERVEADPLARLANAAPGAWSGLDPVEHQRLLRDEWPA
jgi:AbrB family looped-hinge helix DNA binding protein